MASPKPVVRNNALMMETAFILCGGLGNRLRPHTDHSPKPMMICNGRPFLWHVLAQLNQQGVTRFVLATGYLKESIRDFFGDGSAWGWSISYSEGAVEWDTGRRLWEARELLPEAFVLLYGDNFTLFDLPRSQEVFTDEVDLTLLVTEKERGEYKTTGNVMMRDDGVVLDYDKTPYQKGYDHVEIGYMLTRKTVMLNALDDKDCNLSSVLMTLCREGTANAVISPNPYFWITDPDSWKRAEDYLATLDIFSAHLHREESQT